MTGTVNAAPLDRTAALAGARAALGAGEPEKVETLLAPLARRNPANAETALLRGVALRRRQMLAEAAGVFAAARAAGSDDPRLLEGLAQTRYELGQPAAVLLGEAMRASPGNRDLLRNHAAALATEGEAAKAEALLEAELARAPGWIEGHKALATLRWTSGDQPRFAESYPQALALEPGNRGLWLAWFSALAQVRDWAGAGEVLNRAEAALGPGPALAVSRLFVASESGAEAQALLAACAGIEGDTVNLCRVRHLLRQRRPREAGAIAIRQLETPAARLFWPYLSLAWRLAGDARAEWLDRPEAFVRAVRVDLTGAELAALAEVLRGLHVMARPYVEQSVRGGTQTDRSVILRHEPELRRARAAWIAAIRDYVAALPPAEPGHPLLGTPRGELLIEGSWSVRLTAQGYNVPHNHPLGWLSTAFYIALPDPLGAAPAGHFAYGTPPEELGLTELAAYGTITPEVGVSAVFPSTMWHRTIPFADGERLVMALDIRPPRR